MAYYDGPYFGGGYWNPEYWARAYAVVDDVPCEPIQAEGGKGTGVCPEGTDFPFVAPSADIQGILADLVLTHEVRTAVLPLAIIYLSGMDKGFCQNNGTPSTPHAAEVVIADANGRVVFDSRTAPYYTGKAWSARTRIHEWQTAKGVCRLVQHISFPDAESVRTIPAEIVPVDGRLDERCATQWPDRVDRITVSGVSGGFMRGRGSLVAGYNIELTPVSLVRGLRKVTRITVDAAPGGGLGTYPGCQEPAVNILRINGLEPDDHGNFTVGADGCYWVRVPTDRAGTPPQAIAAPASLRLGNDCGPCCDCTDYIHVQKAILNEWTTYSQITSSTNAVISQFKANIARWEKAAACRAAQRVQINALPVPPNIEVAVAICNSSTDCLYHVAANIAIESTPTVAFTVDSGATVQSDGRGRVRLYNLATVTGGLAAYWDMVPPQVSVNVRFRLGFGAATGPTAVTLTATATANLGAATIPGTAAMIVQL